MTALVLPLGRVGAGDVALVGGKGASLGELVAAGLPVPDGYVVTTVAFETALRAQGSGGRIRAEVASLEADDHEGMRSASARLRARMEQAVLPGDLEGPMTAAYTTLCPGGDEPVAVRSSATSEDSARASFAGMQDTFLWVRGREAVVHAVRRCWASLYSVESLSYRLRLHVPEDQLAMAVVVQRMVDARSAGVAFTRSPTTGDRSVVAVDASWGLGSAVVSGEVTPDTFVFSKVTRQVTSRTVNHKERLHRPDPAGSGVLDEAVAAERADEPSVSDDELVRLVDLALRVERHYGQPMDIEWAIDAGNGSVALLQARPETAWVSRDKKAATAEPKPHAFDHVTAMFGARTKTEGRS